MTVALALNASIPADVTARDPDDHAGSLAEIDRVLAVKLEELRRTQVMQFMIDDYVSAMGWSRAEYDGLDFMPGLPDADAASQRLRNLAGEHEKLGSEAGRFMFVAEADRVAQCRHVSRDWIRERGGDSSPEAFFLLGETALTSGDFDEARLHFARMLELGVANTFVYQSLGRAYLGQGKEALAAARFNDAQAHASVYWVRNTHNEVETDAVAVRALRHWGCYRYRDKWIATNRLSDHTVNIDNHFVSIDQNRIRVIEPLRNIVIRLFRPRQNGILLRAYYAFRDRGALAALSVCMKYLPTWNRETWSRTAARLAGHLRIVLKKPVFKPLVAVLRKCQPLIRREAWRSRLLKRKPLGKGERTTTFRLFRTLALVVGWVVVLPRDVVKGFSGPTNWRPCTIVESNSLAMARRIAEHDARLQSNG